MNKSNKIRDIAIYKANKKNTGAAAQFKLGHERECMFLEMAKQVRDMNDSKPYDWENTKICIKLGIVDITKILSYFHPQLMYYRKTPESLKLFHKLDNSSKTIELKWQEYKGRYSYLLSVSSKVGDNAPNRLQIPISLDEVELLKVGLVKAIEIILGW